MSLRYRVTGSEPTPAVPAQIVSDELGGVTLTPHATTQVIYVDSVNGSDDYDGLWPTYTDSMRGPKKTAYAGMRAMRHGSPDWLLFKRGCTWTDATTNDTVGPNIWTTSGLSSSYPQVIGAYGTGDAPVVCASDGSTDPCLITLQSGVTNVVNTGAHIHSTRKLPSKNPTDHVLGFTYFTPTGDGTHPNDTKIVYVSDSGGSDTNDGLSPSTPKKTISAGRALLRTGHPDWLLLKAGDVFSGNGNATALNNFNISGVSAANPILVSSYGSGDRPWIKTGSNTGVNMFSQDGYCAFVSLRLTPDTWDGTGFPRGLEFDWGGAAGTVGAHDILIEDCLIEQFQSNIVFYTAAGSTSGGPREQNLVVRRNIILDAYNIQGSNSEGLYIEGVDGILIEENVFDNNGWGFNHSLPTWYRHNIYMQNGCTGVVLRGNVIARTDGGSYRSGGIVQNNLLLKTAGQAGILLGDGNNAGNQVGGVTGLVGGNIIIDGNDVGIPLSGYTWTESSKTLTKTGGGDFTRYTFHAQDHVWIDSGTGATPGQYVIASRVSADAVTLTTSIGAGADGQTNIAGMAVFDSGGGADGTQGGAARGWALTTGNCHDVPYRYNIIASQVSGHSPRAIQFNFADHGQPAGGTGIGIVNCAVDGNIVYKWKNVDGGGLVNPQYDTTGQFVNVRFTRNDFQDYDDTIYLANCQSSTVTANFLGARNSGEANRWWRQSGNSGGVFRNVNNDRTFSAFMSDIGDAFSTFTRATYTDPDNASGGAYFLSMGGANGVISDGTLSSYLSALRLQSKSGDAGPWSGALMPTSQLQSYPAGFAYITSNSPTASHGAMRWLRQKFNDAVASMGLRIDTITPSHGTHSGGTSLAISGAGFLGYADPTYNPAFTIKFGGTPAASFTVNSDTSMTVITDSHDAGTVDVVVDNGDGIYTKASGYTYDP